MKASSRLEETQTTWVDESQLDPGTYYVHVGGIDEPCFFDGLCPFREFSEIMTLVVAAPPPQPPLPPPPPPPPPVDTSPPPAEGYFPAVHPAGDPTSLPDGQTCAAQVHRSAWEPRPENMKRNHTTQDAAAIHASLGSSPRSTDGSYDPRYDSWLVPRIDGQFAGTTDEIFQWAACKWGVPDNVIRAAAYQESTWYQYLVYPDYHNRCVSFYGCGDFFGSASAASKVYCDHVATFGYDYQQDYGDGLCPQTFSILGIKSWWDPAWGFNFAGNQNGSFPFNRDSTAFAADYYAAELRTCLESWVLWLPDTTNDLWGCVGYWFSGDWHSPAADQYAAQVQAHLNNHVWLQPGFENDRPACHPTYGCPGPDGL